MCNACVFLIFPRVTLNFFSTFYSFMVVWGCGCGVLGWAFQLMGLGPCGIGASGAYEVRAQHMNTGVKTLGIRTW